MLTLTSEKDELSKDKKPSPELFEMIQAAASSLTGFAQLWESIRKKGTSEGFSDAELQDMLRPLLRDRLGMSKDKIYYLFHQDERKEQTHRYIAMNAAKKETEQSYTPEQTQEQALAEEKEFNEWRKEQDKPKDDKDIQIEYLKDTVVELEEALRKTQKVMIPATHLEEPVSISETKLDALTDDQVFNYLKERARETGDIIFIDRVGSGALAQSLYQYKGSFGVAELFLRIIK